MSPVTVTLHGNLNRHLPGRERVIQVEAEGGSTIGHLLEEMGVPVETLWMLSLNGESALPETPLSEGDRLEVFPILCGGNGFDCS